MKNQTIGLIQSGKFPPLINDNRFPGNTLVFFKDWNDSDYWMGGHSYNPYNKANAFTVFFVNTTKLEHIGSYYTSVYGRNKTGDAYRAQCDIYVIKYPEKTPIGKYTIISEPPFQSVGGDRVGGGDYYDWIWDRIDH